jgi:hypothetical protein
VSAYYYMCVLKLLLDVSSYCYTVYTTEKEREREEERDRKDERERREERERVEERETWKSGSSR